MSALKTGHVYPVFQPIVTALRKLSGFELLIRWNHKTQEIPPDQFLQRLKERKTWLSLTHFILNSAVEEINRCEGRYTFSVNIPLILINDIELVNIISDVSANLLKPEWRCCLILEYPETTQISTEDNTLRIADKLKSEGYKLYLDDCYSESSVVFPVRQMRFDGYKLDKRIIQSFANNPDDTALIKTLVFYSKLSGSSCVAEGVETIDTFTQLFKVGIDIFQGYLFSPPVQKSQLSK
ncbi:EAL domain-containing protein, partial [Citrobacter portucalensis]|uniref:EAL domain-containing protein n=1 Tax=Citrobacter portucalensis TaxID=1639133 RepID=UPI00226B383C